MRKKGVDYKVSGKSQAQTEFELMKEKLIALGLDKEEANGLSPERQKELLYSLPLLRLAYYELNEAV